MKISIQGTVFNISFDNKKIVRGWWLLVDNDGEEYLVRQNFFYLVSSYLSLIETYTKRVNH